MLLGWECCLVGRRLASQHRGTSTQEMLAEKSQVQGHSWLHNKVEPNLKHTTLTKTSKWVFHAEYFFVSYPVGVACTVTFFISYSAEVTGSKAEV